MSSFVLKMIGLISMIIDHSSYVIYGDVSWLNYIGRIAFPIFAFQTTISFQKTKNRKKYLLKLLIFAVIAEIPYVLFFDNGVSNILFTLFLGNICIILYDKISEKALSLSLILLISIIAEFLQLDYGAYGIWLIMLFYIFRNKKMYQNIFVSLLMILLYGTNLLLENTSVTEQIIMLLCSLSSLIFINLYNGKEGYKTGYLFYIIYPLHLLIFYLLK